MQTPRTVLARAVLLCTLAFAVVATGAEVHPAAILPFQERGREVAGLGAQASEILFAELVADPELYLVDRAELKDVLQEAELNLSGMVNPAQATQVGQLTGAKILITGSVMEVGGKLYAIAKIIGTETSRVLGASVKGERGEEIDTIVERLAGEVSKVVTQESDKLVAKVVSQEDQIKALKAALGDAKRPTVFISIPERHVGQRTVDPAAETEIMLFCKETGFDVATEVKAATVRIEGEGFSESALRRGNLISVKARLEIKAVDIKTDNVIAADRQTAVVVDLVEQMAGKAALQQAAARIAQRLLPKLAK